MNDFKEDVRHQTIQSLPQLNMGFQPKGLPQFPIEAAIKHGTLWKPLFSPYQKGETR